MIFHSSWIFYTNFYSKKYYIKILSISIIEFLDASYILCPHALQSGFPPSCHPVLRTREREGWGSQPALALARVEEEGGWGTEEEGEEGCRGLEPSNSFQLLPHPPDFLPWEWCLVGFSPLFSH